MVVLVAVGVAAGGLKPPEWWWQGWREMRGRVEREVALTITWCKMKLKQINPWLKFKHKNSAFANDN